ncbi:MAG: aminotransferase class I/II-fold pyridoxal phosphate-dependent enzyme [Alphaproteobacteria bacterium]|nr:aminotransferase class I/II-fold pyridoxal phosphate-dependent enzyme [Alphaproteobacteria bacterium]
MDVMRSAFARQASGQDVLHMEVGEPGTPAPAAARAAAAAALDGRPIGYTEAMGIPALRQAIAAHYQRTQGVAVDPQRICVTAGSSAGFILGFSAAFDPGDRVGLAAPGYPCYRHILTALGLTAVSIPVGRETRFQPTPETIEAAEARDGKAIDGLIVASPSNPTGSMLLPEEFGRLATWCRARAIRLVSDEIYHGITYERPAVSILALPRRGLAGAGADGAAGGAADGAIVVNSFSKYFSMTGWRLGWLVLPPELIRPVECLAQNYFISAPTLSQIAAVAAFDATEELEGHVRTYARNRAILWDALKRAGIADVAPPDGAFYLYADVGHLTNDSLDFCRRLLAETGIAITPGLDFDPERGSRTIRFSFAGPTAVVEQVAERFERWVRR